MMLSCTGPAARAPPSIAARSMRAGGHHGVVWRVRPTWGPHLLLLLLLVVVSSGDLLYPHRCMSTPTTTS